MPPPSIQAQVSLLSDCTALPSSCSSKLLSGSISTCTHSFTAQKEVPHSTDDPLQYCISQMQSQKETSQNPQPVPRAASQLFLHHGLQHQELLQSPTPPQPQSSFRTLTHPKESLQAHHSSPLRKCCHCYAIMPAITANIHTAASVPWFHLAFPQFTPSPSLCP